MSDSTKAAHTADYWYENRDRLREGMVFQQYDGSVVKLDHRKPGDGTQWVVADWYGIPPGHHSTGWSYSENIVEPGDLRGDPIEDSPTAIARAKGRT